MCTFSTTHCGTGQLGVGPGRTGDGGPPPPYVREQPYRGASLGMMFRYR